MTHRVAVAMSGGVDSSVAAHLICQAGHEAVGISMMLFPGSRCCNSESMRDAREVAESLGMPFHKADFVETFRRKVVDHFAESYMQGQTPNPCAICNSEFKFSELFELAQSRFGCDRVVTGHYARIRYDQASGRYQLLKAIDASKDQSYVLYGMTQAQLARADFPLGEMRKPEVRELAGQLGLAVADKPESMDLCFTDDTKAFLRDRLQSRVRPGEIVDLDGKVLGRHEGIVNYTIGQRRGLGLASPEPLYVIRLDVEENRVVVGPREATLGTVLLLEAVNWCSIAKPEGPIEAEVKIRYRSSPAPALVEPLEGDRLAIRFFEPQSAITPGQVAVLYANEVLLAGGLIAKESGRAALTHG